MRVEQSLLAELWNSTYVGLGFNPAATDLPFPQPAVAELAKTDRA